MKYILLKIDRKITWYKNRYEINYKFMDKMKIFINLYYFVGCIIKNNKEFSQSSIHISICQKQFINIYVFCSSGIFTIIRVISREIILFHLKCYWWRNKSNYSVSVVFIQIWFIQIQRECHSLIWQPNKL